MLILTVSLDRVSVPEHSKQTNKKLTLHTNYKFLIYSVNNTEAKLAEY